MKIIIKLIILNSILPYYIYGIGGSTIPQPNLPDVNNKQPIQTTQQPASF